MRLPGRALSSLVLDLSVGKTGKFFEFSIGIVEFCRKSANFILRQGTNREFCGNLPRLLSIKQLVSFALRCRKLSGNLQGILNRSTQSALPPSTCRSQRRGARWTYMIRSIKSSLSPFHLPGEKVFAPCLAIALGTLVRDVSHREAVIALVAGRARREFAAFGAQCVAARLSGAVIFKELEFAHHAHTLPPGNAGAFYKRVLGFRAIGFQLANIFANSPKRKGTGQIPCLCLI